MKRNMKTRLFSGLIALCMLLTFLPTTAFAADGDVAQVGDKTYATLDEAVAAAGDGSTIELLADAMTAGMNLSKNLTIKGADGLAEKPTITFTDKGIALWGKELTFENCDVIMNGITSTPYTAEWSWVAICSSENSSITLKNVDMVMDVLRNGFKIGNAEVESPKSIQTATAQISQIIANVASSQYGGCSADRIDEVLAPYAEKNYQKHLADAKEWVLPEKQEDYAWSKTQKDIYDAMQSLEYEINTLFTSNGQTPFTSLGFGLGTNRFEREIQKAILEIRIKGLGSEHRTAIFPKLIFTLKRGLNLEPGTPNYDIKQLALECATKRMYPDVLSYDKIVELTGSFKVPMGCRSFLQGWKDENGVEVNSGRMNLGVVTVNLPRIALESGGDKEKFWQIFNERMNIAEDALVYRVERTKEATPANAPILYQYGAFGKRLGKYDQVDQLFRHRRATVSLGYIGLYEVATVFYGPNWEHNPEAKQFTIDIIKDMKARVERNGCAIRSCSS